LTVLGSCQQLPTEPAPIDLSKELPVAVPDTAFTDEDVDVLIDVLANDSSLVDDVLKLTGLEAQPTEGTAEIESGKVRYSPEENYSGIDSLAYVVAGSVLSNSAPVYIVVRPVNDPPVATDDEFRVSETAALSKGTVEFDVLANDSDIDGDPLTVLRTTDPANGQVEIPEGGRSILYVPVTDFVGTDRFRYTISDGNGGLDVADVTVVVDPSNDPPVAVSDSWAVREDEALNVVAPGVLANDSDKDLDLLESVLYSEPSFGTVELRPDGSFSYLPDRDFSGTDVFQYVATDGVAESAPATVTLTVLSVNDRPIALPDTFLVNEDAELNVTAPGILANDVEPEGGALSAKLVSDVASGDLTLGSAGGFRYTPSADFNGTDSFTYVATDGPTNSDPVSVIILVRAVNDAPVPIQDAYEINEDEDLIVVAPGVLENDTDPDGDDLRAFPLSQPANGALALETDGSFVYTPDPNFSGSDGFTYAANDGVVSTMTSVSISILATNDAPTAENDFFDVPANTELDVPIPGVLENDVDADGDRLTVELLTEPREGQLQFNANGSFSYVPRMSYVGDDFFTYLADDGNLTSLPATVTISVTADGRPPVAADDFFRVGIDTVLVVPAPGVLENDGDGDQDILSAVLTENVESGVLNLAGDGGFSYAPRPGFTGVVRFRYRASDGANVSNEALVEITVE
jgi:hypothetical protein